MRITMKRWWQAVMCAGVLALSPSLYAKCDCPKLGFIDSERIYNETRQAQEINDRLQQEFAARRAELTRMGEQGKALSHEMTTAKNAQKRAQLQKQVDLMRRQYLRTEQQFVEDYSLRRNEEFSALQQRANQVIAEIKQREGYNWIDDSAVLVDKKYDITDQVIKALNGE